VNAERWRKNRARLADDHRFGRVVATGRPSHLKIELTNYCNLACPICPHAQMRREVGYMKPELFRRIVEQAAPELEFAYLHHLGESLFHGQIGPLVRAGRTTGAAMGLSTNATFLDERKARALLDGGLDFLVLSIDGASAESYERVRVGGDFATTVENVRRFFAVRRALGAATTVVVQMILTGANRHEVERFAADWRAEGAEVVIKRARDWAGQVPLAVVARAPEPILHTPCKMLWTELTVLWDGAVVPCANVYERENVLGDLNHQTLDEIWNGAPMQALRAAHLRDQVADVRVCGSCPRHGFDHADFVAVGQLEQRRRNYVRTDLSPRAGLS
jgi:radical SAM protein with 4Fe4S-binding SPASM domain